MALVGGTGRMGKGLALQLSRNNEVLIGSRDPARARKAAEVVPGARGEDYKRASEEADMAVVVVPYSGLGALGGLSDALAGKVVASAVNPLKSEGGLLSYALASGSAAEEVARLLPKSGVATAFNHISPLFFERDEVPPLDVLVAADSRGSFDAVAKLVGSVPNLRALYVGPISEARTVEMLTPLVLNLAKLNRTGSLATRFPSVRDVAR